MGLLMLYCWCLALRAYAQGHSPSHLQARHWRQPHATTHEYRWSSWLVALGSGQAAHSTSVTRAQCQVLLNQDRNHTLHTGITLCISHMCATSC